MEHAKADGAAAFNLASGLEDPVANIRRISSNLSLLAPIADEDGHRAIADSIDFIAGALKVLADDIEKKRGQIFDLTWGYAHGPEARGEG